jgi:hypothetical protein
VPQLEIHLLAPDPARSGSARLISEVRHIAERLAAR